MKKNKIIIPAFLIGFSLSVGAQEVGDSIRSGYLKETTGAVSRVYNEDFNKRSAKNIANSLYGYGLGLTTLEGSGRYTEYEPTFYVRGLQSSSTNNPLILVDGIERNIANVTPEEVETVTVLKDASAVALYGYKGINGVISIETKRGKYNARELKFSYDHGFDWQIRVPKMVNGLTYANAINEALSNDGLTAKYSADELAAFRTGNYPSLYPSVDWAGETFRNIGATNIYNLSFRGGGEKFRYYAMGDLTTNSGFIAHSNTNEGYSTQDQYSRANLRTNLDIDLTPKTKLKLNLLGVLSETRTPGANDTDGAHIWEDMIYVVPSAAFPVKLENGMWGGNSTWNGTENAVAVSQAAAYTKYHERSLFADATLTHDFSAITPGLGASWMMAYDNDALYWEDHSRTFIYGSNAVTTWENGVPTATSSYTGGAESSMGTTAKIISFDRVFNLAGTLFYNRTFNSHKIYGQLKYDYEYRNKKGIDQTWNRQNISFYTHYGYKDRYFADLTLMTSASNKLAPGHKWAFSPTIAGAWVLSKEDFMKDLLWVNFLKLRASFGIIQTDRLPLDDDEEQTDYWEQTYGGGGYYPFDTNYSVNTSSWSLGRLASLNSTHEKAYKYNLGLDAVLFNGLNLTVDGFYERRTDIWVSSSGKYSSVLGFSAPFENGGVVDSWGFELGADYNKKFVNGVKLNMGINFALSKNKVVEMLEEPKLYENLVRTGKSYSPVSGLQAIGFFKDQAEIDASPKQMFGDIKPGDIKYKDINGDNQIDENDNTVIGYSTKAPEIYYSFHMGLEYKGLGVDAQFQGTGNYSAMLNTKSLFWPLINNTTISQHYYDNRWTSETPNAKYPRLSSQSNDNNFQSNTIWLADRSFLKLRTVELYYKFPEKLMKTTKCINSAKLYVRGVDLLCFDHIKIADPESYGATYPLTRSVFAGVTISF